MLIGASWDVLRTATTQKAGGCSECGVKSNLECHEIWDYDEINLVQTLIGLESLCGRCHETRHLGFARVRGRFESVFARLLAINRLTIEEGISYSSMVEENFLRRSEVEWALDLSIFAGYRLRLKRAIVTDGEGMIAGDSRNGPVCVRILGAKVHGDGGTLFIS